MLKYSRYTLNYIRKTLLCLTLIGIGYLLGNAFPSFEVVPYGYRNLVSNPLSLDMGGCVKDCNIYDDEVKDD